jgi:hypothetical protein
VSASDKNNHISYSAEQFPFRLLRAHETERLRPLISPAQVKGGHHVFGECQQATRLLTSSSSLFPAPGLLFVFLLPAAQGLHGFLTAYTERDDYINKAPCFIRVLSALPQGIFFILLLSF